MARTSRTVCVLIPFICTLVALIVLILVFAGNTSSSTQNLYFVKANTTNFILDSDAALGIQDWYTIGLWNYCSGPAGTSTPTFCSPRRAFFWFNPIKIWHLQDTPAMQLIGSEWKDALGTYQSASKWLFIAYIGAIGATGATLVVSVCAFCRRLGSVITSLVALVAAVFSVGAAVTATVLYLALVGFIKTNLGGNGLQASLGTTMFALMWLAAAASVFAFFFFLFTACCCAGRSSEKPGSGPESYQRVPSPYASTTPWPSSFGTQGYSQYKSPEAESVPLHSTTPWPSSAETQRYSQYNGPEAEAVPLHPYQNYDPGYHHHQGYHRYDQSV